MLQHAEQLYTESSDIDSRVSALENEVKGLGYDKAETLDELTSALDKALGGHTRELDTYKQYVVMIGVAYHQAQAKLQEKMRTSQISSIEPSDVEAASLAFVNYRHSIESIGEDEYLSPVDHELYRFKLNPYAPESSRDVNKRYLLVEKCTDQITTDSIRDELREQVWDFDDLSEPRQNAKIQEQVRNRVVWKLAAEDSRYDKLRDIERVRRATGYIDENSFYESTEVVDVIEVDIDRIMASVNDHIFNSPALSAQVDLARTGVPEDYVMPQELIDTSIANHHDAETLQSEYTERRIKNGVATRTLGARAVQDVHVRS